MGKTKGKTTASKQPSAPPTYAPKDVVLGKIRGYPSWPGWIRDADDAPPKVKKERPGGKNGGGGGKNLFSLVQFFPTGDFAWLAPKDISRLKVVEIESYLNEPTKKNGELLTAYRVALNPYEWESKLANQQAGEDEDADADADGDIDELASEPTENKRKRKAPAPKKTSKRGKKDAESEDEGEPPAKKATKSKKDDKKEEDAEGEADGDVPMDKKALEVRDWRHKLQKTFLSPHKTPAKESDMPGMDTLFKTIEACHEITIEQLTFSKIGKVMRHINALPDTQMPPGSDEKYKFRERAKALVDRWHQVLNGGKEDVSRNGNAAKESSPQQEAPAKEVDKPTNGDTKMESPSEPAKEDTIMADTSASSVNGAKETDEHPQEKPNDLAENAFIGDLSMDTSMQS